MFDQTGRLAMSKFKILTLMNLEYFTEMIRDIKLIVNKSVTRFARYPHYFRPP
jgi:hypothetical protein